MYTVFHKNDPLIFYYIIAKLCTIFIKNVSILYVACAVYILCKQLLNIKSKQKREHAQYSINNQAGMLH